MLMRHGYVTPSDICRRAFDMLSAAQRATRRAMRTSDDEAARQRAVYCR